MVSRYFTNLKWQSKTIIEARSNDNHLWRHKDGRIEKWGGFNDYSTPADALQRCLDAVERGNWIEIENFISPDMPTSEVTPW